MADEQNTGDEGPRGPDATPTTAADASHAASAEPGGDEPPEARPRRRWRRAVALTALVAVALFLLIQLVPYGWRHSNPPVTAEAPWPDAESAAIARESCYSCHSNETDWPAYSYVAPMSWLVRYDVDRGRDELNFSEWDRDGDEADDAIEMIREGEMPLSRYTLIHRDAHLSDAEADRLVAALEAMDDGGGDEIGDEDRGDSSGPGSGD